MELKMAKGLRDALSVLCENLTMLSDCEIEKFDINKEKGSIILCAEYEIEFYYNEHRIDYEIDERKITIKNVDMHELPIMIKAVQNMIVT